MFHIYAHAVAYTCLSHGKAVCKAVMRRDLFVYRKTKREDLLRSLTVIDEYLFLFFRQGIVPVLYVELSKFIQLDASSKR